MQLSELSDKQIHTFIKNYEDNGQDKGGIFSLAELKVEILRRTKSPFPAVEVARTIVSLSQRSTDGLVSYKQVWERFRPNAVWVGNAPRTEMAKALGSVIAYCIDKNLPILTTLVVQAGKRMHSEKAILNIYNEARSFGVDVGLDANAFVKGEQEKPRTC